MSANNEVDLNVLFHSDDKEDFEGFGPDEIQEAFQQYLGWMSKEDRDEDEENTDDNACEVEWKSDSVNDQPEFTANSGLNEQLPDNAEPIDYFNLFFTDELMQIITIQTNLFAEQT